MAVQRLAGMPGFHIDRVAAAAGDDPRVLRLENLDTDVPAPAEATRPWPSTWSPAARRATTDRANEPVERLAMLGERVRRALVAAER